MDKPWFNLDPNNLNDRWWLYTSIVDTKKASMGKNDMDIQCYLILQDHNMGGIFYRISIWYKDDPNRYVYTKFDYEWNFDKTLKDMHEGDIIGTYGRKFKVYNCSFSAPSQLDFCKILERIE